MRFIDLIPQPHRSWWREWGLDFDLFETRAACGSCNMTARFAGAKGALRDGETQTQTYDAELKCCTFFPEVPNFVWSQVAKKFEKPVEGVLSPRGLEPALSYQQRFAKRAFGQSQDLRCPFFTKGLCGIWETRPSPCVRFVCQSSYGMTGQRVWEVTEALLGLTEKTLANDVLLRLGLSPNEIKTDGWFEFLPDSLFARAEEIVAALSAEEVWELIQPEASALRDDLCQAAANAIGSQP